MQDGQWQQIIIELEAVHAQYDADVRRMERATDLLEQHQLRIRMDALAKRRRELLSSAGVLSVIEGRRAA